MSAFTRDLRFAVRQLRRRPTFTVATIATLALGIGLNTAVFSAIDALLIRPVPGVQDPDAIVHLYRRWPGIDYGAFSPPTRTDVRDRMRDAFTDVAAWEIVPLSMSTAGRADYVVGQLASANYFSLLGVHPYLGRLFGVEEEQGAMAHPVVVVDYSTWRSRFGADSAVVGRTIRIDGSAYTVIGVAPPGFKGMLPIVPAAFWVPMAQIDQIDPEHRGALESRGDSFLNAFARLRPGVTLAQARGRLAAAQADLLASLADDYHGSSLVMVPQAEVGLDPSMRGAEVGMSAVVMAVVGLLLLIACVNVANLFLARATERWREIAVRVSIGAGRWTLVRQLLTESLLLASIAGAVGTLLAWWVIGLANRIQLPTDIPIAADLRLSIPVLTFTLGISLVSGLAFGLVPAWMSTRPSLVPALKGEAPAGASRSRASRALIVTQMALSVVLLVAAGLFLRSLRAATAIDKGFDADHVMLASFDLGLQGYPKARAQAFVTQLDARLRADPNVTAVGFSQSTPLTLGHSQRGITVPGYVPRPDEQMSIDYNLVSPGYFAAMGMRFTEGQTFTAGEDSTGPAEIVVNARFAERFWPGRNPIGQTVVVGRQTLSVVGVLPVGKYHRLGEDPLAFMYLPQSRFWHNDFTMNVRTRGDPVAFARTIRREIAALDPDLPLANVRTMNNMLGIALMPARLAGSALGMFGLIGLALAAVGMYGVISYGVSQRTREIGIRIALGAQRGAVVRLIVRQGMALVGIGTAVGLVGAVAVGRLVRSQLYGANAADPATIAGVTALLGLVALLAVLIPARRAATLDPIVALRMDG